MKILVTGANGQVGQEFVHLVKSMESEPKLLHDIVCFDRKGLDITDAKHVKSVLASQQPNLVINCAAYTAVDRAEIDRDAAFSINEIGPRNLAITCHNIGAALFHISTDYVFSGDKKEPYNETDPTGPSGVYGESKLAGEIAIAEVLKQHIILRTSWVFGEHGDNFVKAMLRLGVDRDELGIVCDQVGAPTSAKSIADCCMAIANQINFNAPNEDRWGVYHYSGAPFTSWHGFAEVIFTQAVEKGLLSKAPKLNAITSEQFPTSAKRPANSMLSCDKLNSHFAINIESWNTQLVNIMY